MVEPITTAITAATTGTPWQIPVAGMYFLKDYLGGQGWLGKSDEQQARERRLAASNIISSGYTPTALPANLQETLSQYLSGGLTAGQQATLDTQRRTGMSNIMTTAAGTGMPMGGRLALSTQLNRDLGTSALNLGAENQKYGFEQSLADYLRKEVARQNQAQLMAQYQ